MANAKKKTTPNKVKGKGTKSLALAKSKAKGGSSSKAWMITGLIVLLLAGLGFQTWFMARRQAKLKIDMIRAGKIIPQGRDKGQGSNVVAFEGDKQDNLYFLEGDANVPPRLQKFDSMGNFVAIYEPRRPEQLLNGPADVTTDAAGLVYVLTGEGRVQVLDKDLRWQRSFKVNAPNATGIGVDAQGRIYISSEGANKILVLTKEGKPESEFGAPGTRTGDLVGPVRMRMTMDDRIVVMERLPAGARLKVFSPERKVERMIEVKGVPMCPPMRMGVTSDNKVYINDHMGSKGMVIYDAATGKYVGSSQITKDGERFVSPGAVGANKWTQSVYLHTVPGLIKCVLPSDEEESE